MRVKTQARRQQGAFIGLFLLTPLLHQFQLALPLGNQLFQRCKAHLRGEQSAFTAGHALCMVGKNPALQLHGMFEPPHGSAPDIAGRGLANPIAAILTGAMMLSHLGEGEAAARVETATARVVADGSCLTPDAGGTATTHDVAAAIIAAL